MHLRVSMWKSMLPLFAWERECACATVRFRGPGDKHPEPILSLSLLSQVSEGSHRRSSLPIKLSLRPSVLLSGEA